MPCPLRSPLPWLLSSLLLAACSQVSLTYRHLDWLIAFRVDQYTDLQAQQKRWLQPQIQRHLHWHCSSELPRYTDWLTRVQLLIASPAPETLQLDSYLIEAEQAVTAIIQHSTPTTLELLAGLNSQQVDRLHARLLKDSLQEHKEILQTDRQSQISKRSANMQKRVKPWLGSLSEQQRLRIEQWASESHQRYLLWLEGRQRWQSDFRAALDARHSQDFKPRMGTVLSNLRGTQDPQRAELNKASRQALATLFSDLLATASTAQKRRLTQRVQALHSDLSSQICQEQTLAEGWQTPIDSLQSPLLEEFIGVAEMAIAQKTTMGRQG